MGYATDLGEARNEKFLRRGLDRPIAKRPVGQITWHNSDRRPRERGDPYAVSLIVGLAV
jgi:hypothetical protein